jgi:hypothetical protein
MAFLCRYAARGVNTPPPPPPTTTTTTTMWARLLWLQWARGWCVRVCSGLLGVSIMQEPFLNSNERLADCK